MAVVGKLILRYDTNAGEKNFIYNYVNPDITLQYVQSLITALITNGSIYRYPPVSIVSAKLVKTEEQVIELSNT